MKTTGSRISSLRTVRTFLRVGTCSEAMCNVLDRAFARPLESEEHAALPFAGGIAQHGYQCGLLWGATLAAGAQSYRELGAGPRGEARAVIAAQRLVEAFRARNRHIECLELTDTDWKKWTRALRYMVKGGPIKCFGMAARFAPIAHDTIRAALAEPDPDPMPAPPVSCAAEMARRLGLSELQTVMAAGLAGGIGLSGSGCGALGTAVWTIGLRHHQDGGGKLDYKDPRVAELVEEFLRHADFELTCSDIVGRPFESVADHADHLRTGGCTHLFEALERSDILRR